jgi:hypothetical protein
MTSRRGAGDKPVLAVCGALRRFRRPSVGEGPARRGAGESRKIV